MSEKLTYTGRVDENGKAILPGAKMRIEIARLFTGKEIEVTIRKKRKRRSTEQNRYYWGVVVPLIQSGLKEIGEFVTIEDTHEILKIKFLRRQRVDENTGEVIFERTASTADLSTVEFLEYIERCALFAAEWLGVTIPEPT